MSLRQQRPLRALARRLPVFSSYERRLAESAQTIAEMAEELTDCRESRRLWVPVGHYYSPFVDVAAVQTDRERIFGGDATVVPAVDLRLDEQRALMAELHEFAVSFEFSATEAEAKENGRRYWADNPSFGDSDARFLTAMLRHFRPQRLIELGCGYSSAVTLDARDRYLDHELELTFLDPYPELLQSLVREADRSTVSILPIGTQDVDLDLIRQLRENDVLFIDSTHVSKSGSDVNRIFFEILPALRPGVLIHLHDIFPNFEYPLEWVLEQRAWTEQYLLRAFLQFNASFEIVMWPVLLWALDPSAFAAHYPNMNANAGSGFWMRKVA